MITLWKIKENQELSQRDIDKIEEAQILGLPLEENVEGFIKAMSLHKTALSKGSVDFITQEYINGELLSKEDKSILKDAFINKKDFNISNIPVVDVFLKSGIVILNIVCTIEYLIKRLDEKV